MRGGRGGIPSLPEPYYADDSVTLYHGDCLEVTEWLTADVLVTDPPYGLGDRMQGGPNWSRLWSEGSAPNRTVPLAWDASAPLWLVDRLGGFAAVVIWGGNYFPLPPSRGWLVWDKLVRNFSSGHCELAWTSLDQPVRAYNFAHAQLASEGKVHPTQKPIGLMEWCLNFLPPGSVADPFAGSGTTLVAAKALGRQAIGVELEERYCEIAARRLSQDVLDFGASVVTARNDPCYSAGELRPASDRFVHR
jgi:DNA modification methylase